MKCMMPQIMESSISSLILPIKIHVRRQFRKIKRAPFLTFQKKIKVPKIIRIKMSQILSGKVAVQNHKVPHWLSLIIIILIVLLNNLTLRKKNMRVRYHLSLILGILIPSNTSKKRDLLSKKVVTLLLFNN